MRRLLLAIGTCAALGLLLGGGYAMLTPPPVTARAIVMLPLGAPVPGPGQSGVTRLTPDIVAVSAERKTVAQAEASASAAVRSYLTRAPEARVLDEVAALPRHNGRRLAALAVAGALLGTLAGAFGALTGRRRVGAGSGG